MGTWLSKRWTVNLVKYGWYHRTWENISLSACVSLQMYRLIPIHSSKFRQPREDPRGWRVQVCAGILSHSQIWSHQTERCLSLWPYGSPGCILQQIVEQSVFGGGVCTRNSSVDGLWMWVNGTTSTWIVMCCSWQAFSRSFVQPIYRTIFTMLYITRPHPVLLGMQLSECHVYLWNI